MAAVGWADSHNAADAYTVRTTSLGWFPSHWELRLATRPTHHTLLKKRQGKGVYWQTHGRSQGEIRRPTPPLYFCTCCLSCITQYSKGVASTSSGSYFPFIKPIAMEIVCDFRGPLMLRGVHIEGYHHHCRAKDHPGQNLIFVAPLLVSPPDNISCTGY